MTVQQTDAGNPRNSTARKFLPQQPLGRELVPPAPPVTHNYLPHLQHLRHSHNQQPPNHHHRHHHHVHKPCCRPAYAPSKTVSARPHRLWYPVTSESRLPQGTCCFRRPTQVVQWSSEAICRSPPSPTHTNRQQTRRTPARTMHIALRISSIFLCTPPHVTPPPQPCLTPHRRSHRSALHRVPRRRLILV